MSLKDSSVTRNNKVFILLLIHNHFEPHFIPLVMDYLTIKIKVYAVLCLKCQVMAFDSTL